MFALTVDQVDSRGGEDLVLPILADRTAWRSRGAVLGPDRTAGDEFQLLLADAAHALAAGLRLTRDGRWRVGIGVGDVEQPLPATTGEARGPAFTAARRAIDAARRSQGGLVVVADDGQGAGDVTALLQLLLDLRSRRSAEGWTVADLVESGLSQRVIAGREGVTPQAISQRARAAGVRLERDAAPALARLLAALDRPAP